VTELPYGLRQRSSRAAPHNSALHRTWSRALLSPKCGTISRRGSKPVSLERWAARESETMQESQESAWTLRELTEIEHTYRRATCGPSGYACVRFRCEPSSALSFTSAAEWPNALGTRYSTLLEQAVKEGVMEAFTVGARPISRTCKVVLTGIGWHDVQSSEVAFRRAATEALVSLVQNESVWTAQERTGTS
jgi:hypothetical protein